MVQQGKDKVDVLKNLANDAGWEAGVAEGEEDAHGTAVNANPSHRPPPPVLSRVGSADSKASFTGLRRSITSRARTVSSRGHGHILEVETLYLWSAFHPRYRVSPCSSRIYFRLSVLNSDTVSVDRMSSETD